MRHWLPLLTLSVALLPLGGCARRPCASTSLLPGAPPLLDAKFSVASCCSGPLYVWTGQSCAETTSLALCGCECTGKDCDKIFWSREACERAYAHCG